MTLDTLDTIVTATILAIPIGSYVLGLGYMLWKGL
jgi:hypothetical protein